MSKSARFGVVQVQFNDDGTLFIYQSDSARVLSPELARDLICWLQFRGPDSHDSGEEVVTPRQSTVPAGVVNTSDGPTELAKAEAGRVKPAPSTPPKRGPGRPRKAQP